MNTDSMIAEMTKSLSNKGKPTKTGMIPKSSQLLVQPSGVNVTMNDCASVISNRAVYAYDLTKTQSAQSGNPQNSMVSTQYSGLSDNRPQVNVTVNVTQQVAPSPTQIVQQSSVRSTKSVSSRGSRGKGKRRVGME